MCIRDRVNNNPPEAQIPRAKWTKDTIDDGVRDWLQKHADTIAANPKFATVKIIAKAIKGSAGLVGQCAVWKAFQARRKQSQKGRIKQTALTRSILATRPDQQAAPMTKSTLVAHHDEDSELDWDDEAVLKHYLEFHADTPVDRRQVLELPAAERAAIIFEWREWIRNHPECRS